MTTNHYQEHSDHHHIDFKLQALPSRSSSSSPPLQVLAALDLLPPASQSDPALVTTITTTLTTLMCGGTDRVSLGALSSIVGGGLKELQQHGRYYFCTFETCVVRSMV